ncbi:hypothetical protein GCM10020220_053660 [Nonomuraea rubra]
MRRFYRVSSPRSSAKDRAVLVALRSAARIQPLLGSVADLAGTVATSTAMLIQREHAATSSAGLPIYIVITKGSPEDAALIVVIP